MIFFLCVPAIFSAIFAYEIEPKQVKVGISDIGCFKRCTFNMDSIEISPMIL